MSLAQDVNNLFPMKLGSVVYLTVVFVSVLTAHAAKPSKTLELKSCLKNSLKNATPPSRDHARQNCLEDHLKVSLNVCLSEAQKMEYLTNEQAALKSCYYTRPAVGTLKSCFGVAKKLHSLSDRDGMRLDCISTYGLPSSSSGCLKAANSFEQTQYKNRFLSTCLEI